jgi:hypothetical protein
LDIYPGISGRLPTLSGGREWNAFFLEAPTAADVLAIYNQGRVDAIWWITHRGTCQNFVNNPTVTSAMWSNLPGVLNQGNLTGVQATLPQTPPGMVGR